MRRYNSLPIDQENRDQAQDEYPRVVRHIAGVVQKLPGAELVVDATGVGRPVVDQLRMAGLSPVAVTITAGSAVTFEDGFWHVPKHELVRALVVTFESDRLRIAAGLSYAEALKDELRAKRRSETVYQNCKVHRHLKSLPPPPLLPPGCR